MAGVKRQSRVILQVRMRGIHRRNPADHHRQLNVNPTLALVELHVYVFTGTHYEKLDWFERINIAGETLTKQELRNAACPGPWLSDAKRQFSRSGYGASLIASDYLQGSPIR